MKNPWLPGLSHRAEVKLRLFCLPYAGGSSIIYRRWPQRLPSDIEVCPVELPGRGRRFQEVPFTRLDDLLQQLGPALLPHLDRPFAFFGHSMGALIAFELTRWLRSHHALQPALLIVTGRHAPHIPDPSPPIHTCSDQALIAHLRRYNGTPAALLDNPEVMALLLPTIRADFQLLETYHYCDQSPLSCAMNVFGGMDDHIVDPDNLHAWQLQTTTNCKIQLLPGDHFFIHTAERQLLDTCRLDLQHLVLNPLHQEHPQ